MHKLYSHYYFLSEIKCLMITYLLRFKRYFWFLSVAFLFICCYRIRRHLIGSMLRGHFFSADCWQNIAQKIYRLVLYKINPHNVSGVRRVLKFWRLYYVSFIIENKQFSVQLAQIKTINCYGVYGIILK